MVVIAQAMISRPRYLLIDELSFGLAPSIVSRLAETIQSIARRGVGILLIEQFTTLALSLAKRAYVMERGAVAFAGSCEELRQHPEILHGAYLASGQAAYRGGARLDGRIAQHGNRHRAEIPVPFRRSRPAPHWSRDRDRR